MRLLAVIMTFAAAAAITFAASASAGVREEIIYELQAFNRYSLIGGPPYGRLLLDTSGAIYGVGLFGGVDESGSVFKLQPPAQSGQAWVGTPLFGFSGNSGGYPAGGLLADVAGALYGVTQHAPRGPVRSNAGTVFKLAPPAAGQTNWTETTISAFTGSDGADPAAGLIADASFNLYGTTAAGGLPGAGCMAYIPDLPAVPGCGTIFTMTPPAPGQTSWTRTVLYDFSGGVDGANPMGRLVRDASGALYGTTTARGAGYGTIFKLTPPVPPATAWSFTVLHIFGGGVEGAGSGDLIMDSAGALYGTSRAGTGFNGTVFQLAPPLSGQGSWSFNILYEFAGGQDGSNPVGGVLADRLGNLYGTTKTGGAGCFYGVGCGTVFRLIRPPAGQTVWRKVLLHAFLPRGDGIFPLDTLVADGQGILYGTTSQTDINCRDSCGTVFTITGSGFKP